MKVVLPFKDNKKRKCYDQEFAKSKTKTVPLVNKSSIMPWRCMRSGDIAPAF
jgi:hypothetical protein